LVDSNMERYALLFWLIGPSILLVYSVVSFFKAWAWGTTGDLFIAVGGVLFAAAALWHWFTAEEGE